MGGECLSCLINIFLFVVVSTGCLRENSLCSSIFSVLTFMYLWQWLGVDKEFKKLVIETTANQVRQCKCS